MSNSDDSDTRLDSDGQVCVTIPPIKEQPHPNSSRAEPEDDRFYDAARDIVPVREMYEQLLDAKDNEIAAWKTRYSDDLDALNGLMGEQKARADSKIADLERQVLELTSGIKESAEEHTFVEGEDGLDIAPERPKRITLTGTPALKARSASAEYLEEMFERIKPDLAALVGDTTLGEIAERTSEWASKYGRKARGEIYAQLTQKGITEKDATAFVMDLVQRELWVDEMFKDFKELATALDVRMQEYAEIKEELAARADELDSREQGLQVTIQKAGEVIAAKAAVEQREAEVMSLEQLLDIRDKQASMREESVRQREEAVDIKYDDVKKRADHLNSDILSLASYTRLVEGYAAGMRNMYFAKHTSLDGRIHNIKQEHGENYGITGAALIPARRYAEKIEARVADIDLSAGITAEELTHLKKRLADEDIKGNDQPMICQSDMLGIYLVGPIMKDNRGPIAHFCITGIKPPADYTDETGTANPRKIVDEAYAKVMHETYKSISSSVLEIYDALQFLGPQLNYLLERLNMMLPEAQRDPVKR